eukprot:1053364-Prorocentrum_minimum.AAC.2
MSDASGSQYETKPRGYVTAGSSGLAAVVRPFDRLAGEPGEPFWGVQLGDAIQAGSRQGRRRTFGPKSPTGRQVGPYERRDASGLNVR